MNFRRGFHRLFLVLGIVYYLTGGWQMYNNWTQRIADRASALADHCPGGHAKPPEPLSLSQVYDEKTCKALTARVEWEWTGPVIFALLPAFLYGIWKVLSWIGRGFKTQPQISN
jgi:hypothetical protein